MKENIESLQLINTAIIKSREMRINPSYEERLKAIFDSPAIGAIDMAIKYLSEKQATSRDQAALQIIDAIRELDQIWGDYVMNEGIDRIKASLNKKNCT